MTHENDCTLSVDQQHVWNTLDTVFIIGSAIAVANPVVLNALPLLCFDVVFNGVSVAINGETDEADLITPVATSLFQHLLVVSHWPLAWRAPGGPEVQQKDLTSLMLDIALAVLLLSLDEDFVGFGNDAHLVSNAVAWSNLDLLASWLKHGSSLFKVSSDGSSLLSHIDWWLAFNG